GTDVSTESNVAVASVPWTWLDTARPIYATLFVGNVSLPTRVQFRPSADSYAEIVSKLRASLTQRGAFEADPEVLTLTPPSAVRRWNATPFACDTSMNACHDEGFSDPRIITPALTQFAWSDTVATRATIQPLFRSGV